MVKKIIIQFSAFLADLLPLSFKRALYRIKPLARLIRVMLNRAAPTGLTVVEIASGALKGWRLSLDLQSEKDYWLGTYEINLQAAVSQFVKPGWVAYDVGANIGYVTLMLAKVVGEGGRIFAFEALPENFERLKFNVELNGVSSQVLMIQGAVTAASTPVKFWIGPSGAMGKVAGAAGRSDLHSESIEVPGYALDDYVFRQGNPAPQVVKIDIEGGEILALPGMQRVLQEHRPVVFLELHGPEAAQISWEKLTAWGYRLAHMLPGYPAITSLDEVDWKAYLVATPLA